MPHKRTLALVCQYLGHVLYNGVYSQNPNSAFRHLMLSYQHAYHAGNYADVIKHFCLVRILSYLSLKEKPLAYIDTHAGRGLYDLYGKMANKTEEFQQGIALLWEERKQAPTVFKPYLDIIKSLNPKGILRYYPGSPYLATASLRDIDRLVFSELHPEEFTHLNGMARKGKRAFLNEEDGIKGLKALLPPIEKRGLIFMDPSFEVKEEYKTIPQNLQAAYARFPTGVFCLWYPILDDYTHNQLITNLKKIMANRVLHVEFHLTTKAQAGLRGSGLWIINPPYGLSDELKQGLGFLKTVFNNGLSSFTIDNYQA